ncbi:MAG: outer spore coat protein CotE [Thomasclavelia sp.]
MVLGTFDVHIWYSNNDDSSVLKQTVSYVNDLDLVEKDSRDFNENDEPRWFTCNREVLNVLG